MPINMNATMEGMAGKFSDDEGGDDMEDQEQDQDHRGSTGPLLDSLTTLDRELVQMESWLDERAKVVGDMRDDMDEIEQQNNLLEARGKSYAKVGRFGRCGGWAGR